MTIERLQYYVNSQQIIRFSDTRNQSQYKQLFASRLRYGQGLLLIIHIISDS